MSSNLIGITNGSVAQSVEQRIEDPRVPGSIPGGTTTCTVGRVWFNALVLKTSDRKGPGVRIPFRAPNTPIAQLDRACDF